MPLRFKILTAFLTLFAAVLAISLTIGSRFFTDQTEAQIGVELDTTSKIFAKEFENRAKLLATALRLLGADHAFKATVALQDGPTLESAMRNLMENRIRQADAFWATDAEGRLLSSTEAGWKAGASVKTWKVVADALEERTTSSVEQVGGRLYELTATPIKAPDVIGVVAAGFLINDAAAIEIKKLTKSDVSFESAGRIIASSLSSGDRATLEHFKNDIAPGKLHIIGEPGRRQAVLAAAVPGSDRATAFVQQNWDDALAPLRKLKRLLLLIGLAGFALTATIGLAIAAGITAPVEALSRATERLERGDYSVRVALTRKDEIGQFGRAFDKMVEGLQEREKIRSVLRKAVSKEIADELLKRGQINLGGETRTVTLLFSDIRDFTSMSEALSPQDLVSQLNAYFGEMTRAIEGHHGVIDKYIGDAIMALFGAPLASEDDADRAQRAALSMIAAMDRHNLERRQKGMSPWKIGIGLNTGPAVAGTLGSQDRWSYTVIGDSVNLASRLEGSTKYYGARVVVSAFTREASSSGFLYRTLDLLRVKGKSKPVGVFELLGENGPLPDWLAAHEEGVERYRNRQFDAAQKLFETVLRSRPEDRPAKTYLERIESLRGEVPDDWDGVHTLSTK